MMKVFVVKIIEIIFAAALNFIKNGILKYGQIEIHIGQYEINDILFCLLFTILFILKFYYGKYICISNYKEKQV